MLEREFYDYTAKHDPAQRTETCPSTLPHAVTRRTTLLEINTVPGLSHRGNLASMAAAADIPYTDLIGHVLQTAFTKPDYLP